MQPLGADRRNEKDKRKGRFMNCRNQGKDNRLGYLLLLAIILLGFQTALGSVFRSDSGHVNISNLHIIDDDLYVFAEALDADGDGLYEAMMGDIVKIINLD